MSTVEELGKRLDYGSPVGMVNSARVILHRPDRSTVILRRGKRGQLGLVGGKIHVFESSKSAAMREVGEETGLLLSGPLRNEGALKMYGRTIWYPVAKYRELGFALPLAGNDTNLIKLWNPRAELYSGLTLCELGSSKVEGRDVVELDLSQPGALDKVKPRHRMVLKAWRNFVANGSSFPTEFLWEEGD